MHEKLLEKKAEEQGTRSCRGGRAMRIMLHIMYIMTGCTRASYRSVTSYRAEIRRVHSVCSENPDSPRVFAPSQKLQATTKKNGETGADFAERRECALLGSPCAHLRVRVHMTTSTHNKHTPRVATCCVCTRSHDVHRNACMWQLISK